MDTFRTLVGHARPGLRRGRVLRATDRPVTQRQPVFYAASTVLRKFSPLPMRLESSMTHVAPM
ncbi:MAG TPA: hypothetical protein PKA58_04630, partial [Polyangium sp.]|nr:hypothetical protein [Polyangium sp.]